MFAILLKKYWPYLVGSICIAIVLGYVKHLSHTISELEKDRLVLQSQLNEKQAYLTAQNIAIEANRADYKVGLARLPTVLHEIETKYKTQYQTIYSWRDQNVTSDCNASITYLNNYQF